VGRIQLLSLRARPSHTSRSVGVERRLYLRGVSSDHPELANAKQGNIQPANQNSKVSSTDHNTGGVSGSSPYTSWTPSPDVALTHANKSGPGGIVVAVPVGPPPRGANWRWEFSDDAYMEQEILMQGRREGVEAMTPEEFSQRFKKGCQSG
jgi:hypothetical protein